MKSIPLAFLLKPTSNSLRMMSSSRKTKMVKAKVAKVVKMEKDSKAKVKVKVLP